MTDFVMSQISQTPIAAGMLHLVRDWADLKLQGSVLAGSIERG